MDTFKTVGELVAELLKQDQNAPVVVGGHYDNDTGLTPYFDVRASGIDPMERGWYMEIGRYMDPTDYPDSFAAVVVA